MPYTRKELYKALDINPGTPTETHDVEELLRVLHERAGRFAAEYQKRPYMQRLRNVFGKEFDARLEMATGQVFAKMRKNQEWAFIFQSLGRNCPAVVLVHVQMLWSARVINMVFEQLLEEADG